MTRAELRLCIVWRRRDRRYLRDPYASSMARRQVEAVREWRSGEASDIGSIELYRAALAWSPADLLRQRRQGLVE